MAQRLLIIASECVQQRNNPQQEEIMKKRNLAVLTIALMAMGCGVSINSTDCDDNGNSISSAYVDSWINIPYQVRNQISDRVLGYYSPKLNRYDNYLYPRDLPYEIGRAHV